MNPNPFFRKANQESLSEAYRSIDIPKGASNWHRFMAFAGPGVMVGVGYMDPGNWGTDLEGGSKFGYALLWVILLSNLIAQFLQVLCVRLGLVGGMDLAQACGKTYRKPARIALWLIAEVAIVACDLAEVVGSAVALNMLFGIPLPLGVLITGFDVLILLGLMRFGFRKIEAVVSTLVLTIAVSFFYQLILAKPDWGLAAQGTLIPSLPGPAALMVSIGILGATVMPHNLYLHSSLVQTRRTGRDLESVKSAIRFNTWDTVLALSIAFFVNAAILILAASVFGKNHIAVEELQEGQQLLRTMLGGASSVAFACALLASGQSSTITGTLAGQIVMEGFIDFRITPWLRRLITRSLAIIPAFLIITVTKGSQTVQLLILSQVVLAFQLPFAIFPLIELTSHRGVMGGFANRRAVAILGYLIAGLITAANIWLISQQFGWISAAGCAAGFILFGVWMWRARVPIGADNL